MLERGFIRLVYNKKGEFGGSHQQQTPSDVEVTTTTTNAQTQERGGRRTGRGRWWEREANRFLFKMYYATVVSSPHAKHDVAREMAAAVGVVTAPFAEFVRGGDDDDGRDPDRTRSDAALAEPEEEEEEEEKSVEPEEEFPLVPPTIIPTKRFVLTTRPFRGEAATLRELYDSSFPIKYGEAFYDAVEARRYSGNKLLSVVARDEATGLVVGAATACLQDAGTQPYVLTPQGSWRPSYLLTLAVVPEWRRFGVASALVDAVKEWSRADPTCGALYLHVIHYNEAAIHLYERLGFTKVKREIDFYPIDGATFDAFLYADWLNGAPVVDVLKLEEEVAKEGGRERRPSAASSSSSSASFARMVLTALGRLWSLLFDDDEGEEDGSTPVSDEENVKRRGGSNNGGGEASSTQQTDDGGRDVEAALP